MANKITFQFDDSLDYQVQAVNSTVELFRGISRKVDGIYRPSRTRKFGEGDPVRNTDIVVGSRLFVIDTPYGNYSPDWAVVRRFY